jgi:hypothetical protein
MTRRQIEWAVLAVLLVILAVVLYRSRQAPLEASSLPMPAGNAHARLIPDLQLHLDQLARLRQRRPVVVRRDLFSFAEASPRVAPRRKNSPPPAPPGPPPLQIPLTYYGLAVDPKNGRKLGFFTDGENVYVAAEGDTLLGRFRLMRLGNNAAEFEEAGTGRQATVAMTEPGPGT